MRRNATGYLFLLALCLSLVVPAVAAAAPPSVIAPDGASAFTYQDLQDASAKREGGYAAFDDTEFVGDYDNPHGGYDTSTNKCKVCHAVHRAEGAYYLLRADSQDDACDYCHIGGSAHSSLVVYDNGKYTENGHTIGASAAIPDSTVEQWTEAVTLSSVDSAMNPISEDIQVRAYDATKASMYRFTRHHGHGDWGTGRSGYTKVGPLALRCMNCHQTHNATAQVWRPYEINVGTDQTSATRSTGYKLLKLFPSGSTTGSANANGNFDPGQVVKAPETTLTAGVTYSDSISAEFTVTDDFGSEYAAPVWVAQHIGPVAGDESGSDRDANAVNTAALSVWCADCHNLNIGGSYVLADVELGFKAHTERTHPVPYVGAFSGPGQCYSCHRADLPPVASGDACSQCHYGTGNYAVNRFDSGAAGYVDSDFPHSGEAGGYKMLGSYSVDVAGLNPTVIDETVTVGPDNLDAVCQRCHWVQATYHEGATGGDGHDIPAAYSACSDCHPGGDAAAIHAATPAGCDSCHGVTPLTNDCGTCHPDKLTAHGYDPVQHTASPGSGWVTLFEAGDHDSAMTGDGAVYVACSQCHGTELGAIHGDQCSTCHPSPYDTLGTWSGGCQQGGCHTTYHADSSTAHFSVDSECDECHTGPGYSVPPTSCANCHAGVSGGDTTPPVTTSDAQASYVGGASITFSITDNGLVGVGTTFYKVDGGATQSGSRAVVSAAGAHVLEFWSVDQAGNVESPHKTASFSVAADTTPPVTTSNAQATYTGNANITLTATDNGSAGVMATYYRLDGGPVQTGTFLTVPRVGSNPQPHTLAFWSEDYAGNVEATKTVNFTIVGTATVRLVWWDADVNPAHAPGAGEWADWTIRVGGPSGPIVSTGHRVGPWSGVDDIVLPVSATPYRVYVYYQYWDPGAGFYDQDSTTFPSVLLNTPGTVTRLQY